MKRSIQYLIGAAAVVTIIAGLKLGAGLINQILLAFLLAICITPLPEWLNRKGFPKGLSIAVAIIVVLIGGFLVSVLLANSISNLVDSFPFYQEKMAAIYQNILELGKRNNLDITELIHKINISPEKLIGIAQKVVGSLSSVISSSFIIAILIVFMIIELVGYTMQRRRSRSHRTVHMEWLRDISSDLRKYVSITALKGVITGVLNFIFLVILGVDFAFLWAFFSFLMNFIPNLGFIFSFIPPAFIALITLGPWQAVAVLIAFWLINFIVENVIGPIFMKEQLNISLLTTFLSLLVWGWILGMPGAVLGVPLTIAVMRIYKDFMESDQEPL
jgi:predicted PurR-regulated permease PerM